MTEQEIREKMDLAVKQGYIYVVLFISKKICKLELTAWDEENKCVYMACCMGLITQPIYAKDFGETWALTESELKQ